MLDKSKKDFEGEILKKVPDSIAAVKKELVPLLDEKLRSESVVNNSIDFLSNDAPVGTMNYDVNNDSNQGLGQEQTKHRVLTRSIGGLSPYASTTPSSTSDVQTSTTKNNYNDISDDNPNNWRSGYTETLILFATGVLVLLVFVVSYLMLNYFG